MFYFTLRVCRKRSGGACGCRFGESGNPAICLGRASRPVTAMSFLIILSFHVYAAPLPTVRTFYRIEVFLFLKKILIYSEKNV